MRKKCLILTVLVMLLMPLAGISAQSADADIDYCAIIAEPDCQLLVKSDAVMAEVSSVAFDVSMSLHLLPNTDSAEGDLDVLLTGNGRVALDEAALSAMNDMEKWGSADAAAMAAMLDSLLTGVEGEASLLLTLTEDRDEVSELPINLVMENGVYALDMAAFTEASGEESTGWLGIDLTGEAESMMSDSESASMLDMEGMTDIDESLLTESMTITRVSDSDINGVAVAVFEISIDFDPLLDMMDTMGMMDMMGGMGSDMEAVQAEMDAAMESLRDATMVVRQYIGLEDFYAYRIDVFMDTDIEIVGDEDMDSLFLSFSLSIDLSDFNAPVDVELPDDVFILPPALLQQMSGTASN